jgi:hypothetical protein
MSGPGHGLSQACTVDTSAGLDASHPGSREQAEDSMKDIDLTPAETKVGHVTHPLPRRGTLRRTRHLAMPNSRFWATDLPAHIVRDHR